MSIEFANFILPSCDMSVGIILVDNKLCPKPKFSLDTRIILVWKWMN